MSRQFRGFLCTRIVLFELSRVGQIRLPFQHAKLLLMGFPPLRRRGP
jgi:hypothetical protein